MVFSLTAISAAAGLGGAVLLPFSKCCCISRAPKDEVSELFSGDHFVVGFAVGTALGIAGGVPLAVYTVKGISWSVALRNGLIVAIIWSPLYTATIACGPQAVVDSAWQSGLAVTISAGGLAVLGIYTRTQVPPAVISAAVDVMLSYNLLVLLIYMNQGALTSTLPVMMDVTLFGTVGLSIFGLFVHNAAYCIPYLALCSVILPMSGVYGVRLSCAIIRNVHTLVHEDTERLKVSQPEPTIRLVSPRAADDQSSSGSGHTPQPDGQTPPQTSPAVPMSPEPPSTDFLQRKRHVFVIPNYNEAVELLSQTLTVLAGHPDAASRYGVFLGMEAKESGAAAKVQALEALFRPQFAWMGSSTHALADGELPGKGSNLNFAVRELVKMWDLAEPQDTLLTVLDADCLLPMEYVQALDWIWASDDASVTYNILTPMAQLTSNSGAAPPLVRVWENLYQVSICGLTTQSQTVRWPFAVYSLLLRIPMEVGYWDATLVGMGEDMMNGLRTWVHYTAQDKDPQLVAVHVPYWCLSETTVGARWEQQIRHCLAVQAMGWSITATPQLPFWKRLQLMTTINMNFIAAFLSPYCVINCNLLTLFSKSPTVLWWSTGVMLSAAPGLLLFLCLIYYGVYMRALSEGKAARSLMWQPCAVISSLAYTPLVIVCQQVCCLQAKFWLLFNELGCTQITYNGARKPPVQAKQE